MRVVVTGASGNVGTSLLECLQSATEVEEVIAIARRLPVIAYAKTEWRAADITEADLASLFAGADVVVHLAWLIQPSRDERKMRHVNIAGSRRVFEAVARAGVPALVYASSVGAYAPGPVDRRVDEAWPTTGVASSFYSRHKAEVERILDGFEGDHPGIRVVRMRPALIFKRQAATEIRRLFLGPFLPSPLVRPQRLPLLPVPRGLRMQMVHSTDVGAAYRLAITGTAQGPFNLAAEPVLDAQTLAEILGTRALGVPPGPLRALVGVTWKLRLQPTSPGWLDMGMAVPLMDVSRAQNLLGWSPNAKADSVITELLDGLRTTCGLATPPLDPATSGRLRWRELRTGMGGEV